MERLQELYVRLLGAGFVVLRQAVDASDLEWAAKEIELLHNVPSLLNEPNLERHRYFWFAERRHYLDWLSLPGQERPRSRMKIYYEPIWQEMEPILLAVVGTAGFSDVTPAMTSMLDKPLPQI